MHNWKTVEFLSYFDTVCAKDDCGSSRAECAISDNRYRPCYRAALLKRGVRLRAKVRSLPSTPLTDSLGNFVGMLLTHCRPGGAMLPEWELVDNLAASLLAKISAREP